MRASGELQTVFSVESHMDMIASEIEMDPLEFRLLNALRLTSLPISCEKFIKGCSENSSAELFAEEIIARS